MEEKLELIFRPLEGWPRELTAKEDRKRAPFRSHTIDQNLYLLRKELKFLAAPVAVVQTAHDEKDIPPSTGRPRHDRSPAHPGVMVASDTKYGALKWVCDDCREWQDNIRAIALTLNRLRLADVYGVTRRGEQYLGWKMLPGPITATTTGMSIEAAARFVGDIVAIDAKKILATRGWWEQAYREAAKKLHPDSSRDGAKWKMLQDAAELLNGLHNR